MDEFLLKKIGLFVALEHTPNITWWIFITLRGFVTTFGILGAITIYIQCCLFPHIVFLWFIIIILIPSSIGSFLYYLMIIILNLIHYEGNIDFENMVFILYFVALIINVSFSIFPPLYKIS